MGLIIKGTTPRVQPGRTNARFIRFDEDRQVAVLAFRGGVVLQNWNDDDDWNSTRWWTPGFGVFSHGFLGINPSI